MMVGSPLLLRAQEPECLVGMAEDFVPMTRTERAAEYAKSLAWPQAFVYSAAGAAFGQAIDRPDEWGQGARGFGLRMGSGYGGHVIGSTFESAFALGLHEDNRYFVSGRPQFAGRLAYALSSTFLARHDNGSRVFSLSGFGGNAMGSFVPRTWQPRSTTSLADGAVAFGLTYAARAGINVVREFAPPLIARVFR
jgi:hypothetical protein